MHRPIVLLLALSLTATLPLVFGEAIATGHPLVADAGDSQLLTTATTATVAGQAFGGLAPYTFAWAIGGDVSPFDDPTAATTTVDVAGLGPGLVTLTLTVTDANSDVATDDVVFVVADAASVLDVTDGLGPGVPDEEVGLGGTDGASVALPFTVPADTRELHATLAWGMAQNDLDLELFDTADESATGNDGRTASRPEQVTVIDPEPGTWTALVDSWLSLGETFTLTITAYTGPDLPEVRHNGPYLFGAFDAQQLVATAVGGTSPAGAWDVDGDGAFEAAGLDPVVSLGDGVHAARVRVTDANGLEATRSTTVEVRVDLDHVLPLGCNDSPSRTYKPMELAAAGGVCWMHHGHHTYFLGGGERAWTLTGGQGRIVSVEQLFSPPTEFVDPPVTTPLTLETSLDGQHWTDIGVVAYTLLSLNQRQVFEFTLDAADQPFRYLRIHEPRSAAQGLSGFLDASRLELFTQEVPFTAPALAADQARAYDCDNGDILEDLFADHPCWFGGVNRYDAPSFFHTYTTGDGATLTSISGSVRVAPWRTDDWFRPITGRIGDVTDTSVAVQTSADGITWTTERVVPMTHGVNRPFAFDLDDRAAAFVRLVPEPHRLFDDFREEPSLHHPEAFIVESTLAVEGTLPVALVSAACEANPAAVTLDDRVHVLAGSPPGNVWLYLESNGHRGLQAGAQQVLGLYHHSPEEPEDCDVADTLLL